MEEEFTEACFTILLHVLVEMAEIGKPSDVVASSVNELDINSLMGIV